MAIRGIRPAAAMLIPVTATAAWAQEVNVVPTEQPFAVVPGSCFYLAIIVGLILAISFEPILTHLSVAAGSLVILLLWVYYSSIILFRGAELTQAHAYCVGKEIVPNRFAECDPEAARAHQKKPAPEPEPAQAGFE